MAESYFQQLYTLYKLYSPVEPLEAQASEQQRRQQSWRDPQQTLDRFSTTLLQNLQETSTETAHTVYMRSADSLVFSPALIQTP